MNKQGEKGISWTHWSSNPLFVTADETGKRGWHCTRVSNGEEPSGCDFCYSASMNMGRFGTGLDFTAENDANVTWHLNETELQAWTRKKAGLVFPFDMTDVFHRAIPPEMVVKCFAAMLLSPQMTFQVLTKRPAVQRRLFSSEEWWAAVCEQAQAYAVQWKLPQNWVPIRAERRLAVHGLPNVWAGTTVATQKDAVARMPLLILTPGPVRWVSLEPQLESVTFAPWLNPDPGARQRLDWVVQGGESGSMRPFREEWARAMRDECAAHGVAYFLKQFGEVWARERGLFGADSHGKKLEHFPEDLRLHQFPAGRTEGLVIG